ncbi:MAG: hypothetical protein NUK65_09090 [Firmicutes bacterium]|nr:hypothetical protein [Bacillota bacterium]
MKRIVVSIFFILLFAGCGRNNAEETPYEHGFLKEFMQTYAVTEESPIDVLHWRNQNLHNPGVFYFFNDDGMYTMANYDEQTRRDLEIENIKLDNERITIYVVENQVVDTVGGNVDYYSTMYLLSDLSATNRNVTVEKMATN